MADWKNVKVRGDLHRMVAERAEADRRSVSQMTDVLLTQALRDQIAAEPVPQPEAPGRVFLREPVSTAPVMIEGQTTVDEMLASCPQCAGVLQRFSYSDAHGRDVHTERCVDCGWVREPSDG